MIFDTDIFIFMERGHAKAAELVDAAPERRISVQTYMELMQGAKDKAQLRRTRGFLADLGFVVLPLTENIGHRALIYVEQHALSHGMRAGDAIIAATAVEYHDVLCSANARHFSCITELDLKIFKP